MGLTTVLHTHNRKLDYHPHIHVVIPGGGINQSRNQWKKLKVKYLSRYLYRGVISERNIIKNENGHVTFKYINSTTKQTEYRTLKGEDFLYLILRLVLSRGFRRVRDYVFLYANAKTTLKLVQLILHVKLEAIAPRPRAEFKCLHCQAGMVIRVICHAERSG